MENEENRSTLHIDVTENEASDTERLNALIDLLAADLQKFLSIPLSKRIRELPSLIAHTDERAAKLLREKCGELADLLDRPEIVIELKQNGFCDTATFSRKYVTRSINGNIRQALRASFRLLLNQLMVESLLQRGGVRGEPLMVHAIAELQSLFRQVFGVDELGDIKLASKILQIFDGPIRRRFDIQVSVGRPTGQEDKTPRKKRATPPSVHAERKEKILDAIAAIGSEPVLHKEVADKIGITVRTLRNWVPKEDWENYLEEGLRRKPKK